MTSYTDAQKIANHLGVALTGPQQAQADVVAEAVTVWIDHRTGRTWQGVAGAVVDEIQPITGGVIYLAYPPVTAISQLEVRVRGGSGAWDVWPPEQYTLADPATGRVEITGVAGQALPAYDARVDYTTTVTAPPADVAYAATILAADILFTALHPESAGVDSISVAQNDISIRYTSGADVEHVAGLPLAIRVIDAYRKVVLA